MKYLLCFGCMVLCCASACKSKKAATTDLPAAPQPAAVLIEMKTSPCRGYCPVFKLTFRQDGGLEYEGIRYVEKIGFLQKGLNKQQLERLKSMVANVNLWQYPERFPTTIADAPGTTLTVYEGDKSKLVYGSIERPKPIVELENLLRELAESQGISLKSVDPNEIPVHDRKEIIVKLKPEVNAGNWLMGFQEFKLQLIRRLSSENVWLIAFDPKQVEEQSLLKLMKEHKDVLEAQPNLRIKERD